MIRRITIMTNAIRHNLGWWWGITLGVTVGYYLVLLGGLIARFQHLPNYAKGYDWLANVANIIASTPSIKDILTIVVDEWVLEVGFMNYDFGMGIAEWSLFLAPAKIVVVMALGAILATHFVLLRAKNRVCSSTISRAARASTGVGAACVALTSMTLSWVVCCATPTWVVGLTILGVGASTSLWLEPIGTWISYVGFAALLVGVFMAASPSTAPTDPTLPLPTQSHA